MKKMYIILLAAAAAVVSCAKENFVEPSENNFRIAVAETAPTKSYLDDSYRIVWERGADKVSLFLKTDNNCLTATTTGTTTYLEKAGESSKKAVKDQQAGNSRFSHFFKMQSSNKAKPHCKQDRKDPEYN